MTSIYLCEDNEFLIVKYQKLLKKIALKHKVPITFKSFSSGEQLLFYLSSESVNSADIIYLDILMGNGLNGIETARKLRSAGCTAEIIFLTSNEDYVFQSFDISPLHYILKDKTTDKQFEEVFLKAILLNSRKTTEYFICTQNTQKKFIPLNSISFFEINNRVVTVHYDHTTFEFYSTLDQIELELQKKFFIRCHRSFLVNLKYIDTLNKNTIILSTGSHIPIGSTYITPLKLSFSSYLSNEL